MRNLFTLLSTCVLLFFGQSQNCDNEIPMRVAAASGIKMRAGAGVNSNVVVYIPKDSVVMMCDAPGPVATFEGITGQWRKVRFKEKTGYLFDGFLAPVQQVVAATAEIEPISPDIEKVAMSETGVVADQKKPQPDYGPPPKQEVSSKLIKYNLLTEVYNYCGSINNIDPGLVWYAIYQKDGYSYIKRREIQVLKSKYALTNNLEFDVRVEKSEQSSVFLMGFNTVQNFDTIRPVVYHNEGACELPKSIYPGMQLVLYGTTPDATYKNQIVLSATGNVLSVGSCPEMQQYQLKITGEKNAQPIEQNLNLLLRDLGRCGIPDLRWYGDLNNDGYPELLFVTQRPEHNQFILLTSDATDSDKIYRRAAVWTNYNCD